MQAARLSEDGADQRVSRNARKQREAALDAEIARVRKQVEVLAAGSDPVLAGPFTGEIGFELLYWIPFVRWAVREFPDLRGRLVYLSRGGVQDWIAGLDAQYVDLLSLFPSEDFAAHRALSDKQRQVQEFEARAVEAVKQQRGLRRVKVIHPSLLYNAYFRFLKGNELIYAKSLTHEGGIATGLTSVYEPIEVPQLPPELEFLPDDYVAVHFYSSASFPESESSRQFAAKIIDTLAERTNVVMLGHPFEIDDHRKLDSTHTNNVITIDHLMKPEDNLTLQTPVVGRARAFFGTYGGFSYLAPFLGVNSLSFSMDRSKTHSWHQVLAQRLFDDPNWGDFVSLRHDDLALIELVTASPRSKRPPKRGRAKESQMVKVKERPPEEVRAEYQLHDEVRSNPGARQLFESAPPDLDELQSRIVGDLNVQGYAVVPVPELLSPQAWEQLAQDAAGFSHEMEETLAGGSAPMPKAKKDKPPKPGKAAKPEKPQKEKAFLGRRYKRDTLTLDSPWLQLAASNRLLDIVNAYLGMWTKLSYADQWYSPPRGSEADRVGSMRWHRDYNDQHLVKVFTYLVDVDAGTGPFEYVSGSAKDGPFANEWPWQPLGETYPPQDEFARRIPADAMKTFTAPRGTMILCNTSGFHRGGFATEKARDIWVFNYVSPAALESLVERNFPVPDSPNGLSEVQRFALT